MNRLKHWLPLIIALCAGVHGFGAAPSVNFPVPRGVQRGADAEMIISGGNLSDSQEIFFYSPGFTVAKLDIVNNTQIKASLKVAPDTRLGEHILRVRTATGISNMVTFWVGALPVIAEKEPNSEFTAPQKIPLNVTVTGVVDNEDVDYFAVEAKKGQRISVEVEAMRLATTFFDPYNAILDSKRFELAACDDSPLLKQDGCLSIVAPGRWNLHRAGARKFLRRQRRLQLPAARRDLPAAAGRRPRGRQVGRGSRSAFPGRRGRRNQTEDQVAFDDA